MPQLPISSRFLQRVEALLAEGWDAGCRMVFCAGNHRGLFEHLRDPQTVATFDCDVIYLSTPGESPAAGPGLDGLPRDVASALLATLSEAVSLVHPIANLVAAAGQLGWDVVQALRSDVLVGAADPLVLFRDVLVAAVQGSRTLVMIDSSLMENVHLVRTLCYVVRHSLPQGIPLVLLCGIDSGPETLVWGSDDHAPDPLAAWGPVVMEARNLVTDRLAAWWYLPPLTRSQLQLWLGAVDEALVDLLISFSGADDALAAELWATWRSSGFVHRVDGGWVAQDPSAEPVDRGIFVEIHRFDSEYWELALRTLTLAAVFGNVFSGDVVATLVAEESGLEADTVTDILDEFTTPTVGGDWLLETSGYMSVKTPGVKETYRWRYRFASKLVACHLRAKLRSEAYENLTGLLYRVARDLHANDPLFAAAVARLARETGNNEQAARFEQLAATSGRLRNLALHARLLLAQSELPQADPFISPDVLDANELLVMTMPLRADLLMAQRLIWTTVELMSASLPELAELTAVRAVELAELGRMHWLIGDAHHVAGLTCSYKDPGRSRQHLLRAYRVRRQRYRAKPVRTTRAQLAFTLFMLGVVEGRRGHLEQSHIFLKEALTHFEDLDRQPKARLRWQCAATHYELGITKLRLGLDDALAEFHNAIKDLERLHSEEPDHRSSHMANLEFVREALERAESLVGSPVPDIPGDWGHFQMVLGRAAGDVVLHEMQLEENG